MAQGDDQSIIQPIFATYLEISPYPRHAERKAGMVDAAYLLREQDAAGREYSTRETPLGYTSNTTEHDLYRREPFVDLADFIMERARHYALYQKFNLVDFELFMGSFWMNITPRHAYHAEHIHPFNQISGVYYLHAGPDSGDILFKDPRPVRTMTVPPVSEQGLENAHVFSMAPMDGHVVLFPSWLTHSVRQNQTDEDRLSMSFNVDFRPVRPA